MFRVFISFFFERRDFFFVLLQKETLHPFHTTSLSLSLSLLFEHPTYSGVVGVVGGGVVGVGGVHHNPDGSRDESTKRGEERERERGFEYYFRERQRERDDGEIEICITLFSLSLSLSLSID